MEQGLNGWLAETDGLLLGVRAADDNYRVFSDHMIGPALIQIKGKMTIFLAVILFAMVILVKALAFALRQP